LRKVKVPPEERARFLGWIEENRELRESHGILLELVLDRSERQNPKKTLQRPDPESAEDGEMTILTAWASHEAFDAWIETPDRDRSTPPCTAPCNTGRSRAMTSWVVTSTFAALMRSPML